MINNPPITVTATSPSLDITRVKARTSVSYKQKVHRYIYVPAFTVSDIPAAPGASWCVEKFFFTLPSKISFPQILQPPTGCNYTLVLWWIDDEGNAQRRKLWVETTHTLYCEQYAQEILPLEFAIEVWQFPSETDITAAELPIATSLLQSPSARCFDLTSTAYDFDYVDGTDYIYDLANYIWSGIDGDYWVNGEYGATTFVDEPTLSLDPDVFTFFDSFIYSSGSVPTNGGQGFSDSWTILESDINVVRVSETFNYTEGETLEGKTAELGLGAWV